MKSRTAEPRNSLAIRSQQLMDAVFTVGQYNMVSWALNSFGVPLDDFLPGAKK
jgi:4-carboxymuconolactone decarboxylase